MKYSVLAVPRDHDRSTVVDAESHNEAAEIAKAHWQDVHTVDVRCLQANKYSNIDGETVIQMPEVIRHRLRSRWSAFWYRFTKGG